MTVHVYVSTACQHGADQPELHKKCRLTCKYCGTTCACQGCDHTDLEPHPADVLTVQLAVALKQRDAAEAERDLLRRQRDAVLGFCGPDSRWIRSAAVERLLRFDPADNPPINGDDAP